MQLLNELKPGDPNLINRAVANKLIKAINAILRLEIVRGKKDKVTFEDKKSTLELKDSRGGGGDEDLVVDFIFNGVIKQYSIPATEIPFPEDEP